MLKLFVVIFLSILNLNALTLQQAKIYKGQNISGWLMSEKLDGIRAYWDGKHLLSKKGKRINAPKSFTDELPSFELDGELWTKREDFENIQSIVLDKTPSSKWSEITYNIFEVPHVNGNFKKRLKKVQDYIDKYQPKHLKLIEQKVCLNKKKLDEFLGSVILKGGEGVIVKDALKAYSVGRTRSVLKVKKAQDMEARVIGYKKGTGKFIGMLGSLHVKLKNGVDFFIGSGFSDKERENPPKINSMVTFKYYGFTKYGKPKFASFMRERKEL